METKDVLTIMISFGSMLIALITLIVTICALLQNEKK